MLTHSYLGNRRKYCVYFSDAFQSLDVYEDILEYINQAGIFYVSLEKGPGLLTGFEQVLEQGMNDADIILFYLGDGIEGSKYKRKPVIELEYEYAKNTEKTILAYLCHDHNFEDTEARKIFATIKENETYRTIIDEADLPARILMDLTKTILNNPGMSFWVRSDISPEKVDSITQQKTTLDINLLRAGYYIQQYEKHIDPRQRDQILGPLIDIELRPNISGQAYRFAVKQTPGMDIKHDDLKYIYCIDRFMPYKDCLVYDRLLDITWLIIGDQNFSWQDALDWKRKLHSHHLERVKIYPPTQNGYEKNEWRLPTIEELMTLITERRQGEDYLDKVLVPGDVHWFWSSTSTKEGDKAYYIETTQGSVLRDDLDHLNAIFLCCNGNPQNLSRLVHIPELVMSGRETEILREANRSRHIFSIFLSIYKTEFNDGSNFVGILQNILHKAGYAVECFLCRSSHMTLKAVSIVAEMKNHDAYALVLDRTATPEMLERARSELHLVRNLNLPVLLFHNFQGKQLDNWNEKLGLSKEEILGLSRFKDVQQLSADLVPALNKCLDQRACTGWIRNHAFEIINSSIKTINHHRSLIESAEPLLNAFIESCKVQGLDDAFQKWGIIKEKPGFGEQTWFVSRDNPIQRFFPQEGFTAQFELPILYENLTNRFMPIVNEENCCIVYDSYLELKWWTLGVKKVSFEDAFIYADKISQRQNEAWQVPTIEEMATLITRSRINRKYMDEKVFPRGRWFWTSSRIGDAVYYIDYNYLQEAIRQEELSRFKAEFPELRKKSVILVSRNSPEKDSSHHPIKAQLKKEGENIVDPVSIPILLKAVDFLFDEASKIIAEIRERRKEQASRKIEAEPKQPESQILAKPVTKEAVLRMTVEESVWNDKRKEVAHLTSLLRTYMDNYYLAKEQIAKWGRANVPPIKIHELEEAETGIVESSQKLEKALSAIYGEKIIIDFGENEALV